MRGGVRRLAAAAGSALLAIVPVVPAALHGQAVTGRVLDSASRRALAGVPVRLVRDSAAPGDTALSAGRTAPDGVFTLLAPAPGRYQVRVRDDFYGPVLALATADTVDEHEYVVPSDADRVYGPTEVDGTAGLLDGMAVRYPGHLLGRGVVGCAALEFVVGTNGRAEAASLRVLAASQRSFGEEAAKGALQARYQPAVRAGRRVRAVMRFPVTFAIPSAAPADSTPCVRTVGPDGAEAVTVTATRGW